MIPTFSDQGDAQGLRLTNPDLNSILSDFLKIENMKVIQNMYKVDKIKYSLRYISF